MAGCSGRRALSLPHGRGRNTLAGESSNGFNGFGPPTKSPLLSCLSKPPSDLAMSRTSSNASLPVLLQPAKAGAVKVSGQVQLSSTLSLAKSNQRGGAAGARAASLARSRTNEKNGIYAPNGQDKFSAGDNSCLPAGPPGAVLFLDVDGVLHPAHCRFPRQQFKPDCMQLLKEVVQETGAEIVLSTAWRLNADARAFLAEKLEEHGIPGFVGRTANIDTFHRSREILAWVRKHQPSSWVAIDDWPLHEETNEMAGHFVHSRPRYGVQPDTADQIVDFFREQGVQMGSAT